MHEVGVLIDLGEDRSAPDTRAPLPRDWHRVLLVIGLVATLATGGSAHPGPALIRVAALPGAGTSPFLVTGDAVDVVEPSTVDEVRVSSYPIAGGPRRWAAALPRLDYALDYVLLDASPAGVLPGVLLAVSPTVVGQGAHNGAVAALDARTGRRLWFQWSADLVAVRADLGTAVLVHDNQSVLGDVYAVDLRTGQARWTVPLVPANAAWALVTSSPQASTAAARVVVLVDDRLIVLDQATGQRLASRDVGIPSADDRQDVDSPRLYVIGQRVIVAYEERFHTVLASFNLATLEPRWRSTMPTETSFLAGCGPVLCAGTGILATCKPVRCSAIDSVLYGLDPNSAEVRWSSTTWSWSGPVFNTGPIGGGPGRDGRLLVYNREPPGSLAEADAVVDAGTGRLLLNLGNWLPVPAEPNSATVLVAARGGALDSWFAVLRTGPSPGLRPLGRLPVAGRECQSTERYLVCPTLDRQLVTWRY
jgi:hypothetical protein